MYTKIQLSDVLKTVTGDNMKREMMQREGMLHNCLTALTGIG
jgi:hypothetical protein